MSVSTSKGERGEWAMPAGRGFDGMRICAARNEAGAANVFWDPRGGNNEGAIVFGENIVPKRFVYLTRNTAEDGGWVIRDFISGKRLDSADCVEWAELKLDRIASLVEKCSRTVLKICVKRQRPHWKVLLTAISKWYFGEDLGDGSPALKGPWKPF